jgi:hypothetical protein
MFTSSRYPLLSTFKCAVCEDDSVHMRLWGYDERLYACTECGSLISADYRYTTAQLLAGGGPGVAQGHG